MGVLRAGALPGLHMQSTAQIMDGSLKFDGTNNYLTRSFGSGNRRTWTWAAWVKRYKFGASNYGLFSYYPGSGNGDYIRFSDDDSGDTLRFFSTTNSRSIVSKEKFRDTGWYHIVIALDTTQGIDTERVKRYVNGVRQITNASNTWPSASEELLLNQSGNHFLGKVQASAYGPVAMSNIYFIDGQALGPSYFGFTDPLTGTWRPKLLKDGNQAVKNTQLLYNVNTSDNGFDSSSTSRTYDAASRTFSTYTAPQSANPGGYGANSAHVYKSPTGSAIKWVVSTDTTDRYIWTSENGVDWTSKGSVYDTDGSAQSVTSTYIALAAGSNESNATVTSAIVDFGTNGFYLPMDGNSPIGEDKSGKGNDWTPVNFGGSVALDNPLVSGARPIMNTLPGGTQAGFGVFGSRQNVGYAVTVFDDGGGNKYYIDGVKQATLTGLIRGATYTFDTSDSTLGSTHPFRLSATSAHGTEYTNGVVAVTGAATTITIPYNAPNALYYYCTAHSGMGSSITGITTNEKLADQYASNCTLALPLVGNDDDVCASIACTANNKTPTNSSVTAATTQSNFYSGSHYWNANTDSLLYAQQGNELVFGTNDFTIEFWFYDDNGHNGTSNRCVLFDNRRGGNVQGDPPQLVGWVDSHNEINLYYANGSTMNITVGTTIGKWWHYAAVRSGGTLKLYIDGVEVGSASDTTNYPNNGISLGAGTDSGYSWSGYIQDFRVYTGVAKYTGNFVPAATSPDILPDTPSGVSGSSKLTKITDGAVSFDGTGDRLTADIGSGGLESNFCVEYWIYADGISGDRGHFQISEQSGGLDTSNTSLMVSWGNSEGDTNMYVGNANVTDINDPNQNNVWKHYAVVRNSGTLKLYVNGKEAYSASNSVDMTSFRYVSISGYYSTSFLWKGFISNFRVVSGSPVYTSRFTPPTSPLTDITNTKLLCCQSNVFPGGAAVSPSISGLNNGTQWSSYLTTTQGANSRDFYSVASYPASNLFDGDTSTIVYGGWTDDDDDASDLIFSPPGGVAVSSKLEVYVGYYSKIKVNGSDYNTGGQSTAQAWVTVSDGSNFTGTLTELILENTSNANVVRAAAIRIDDSTILVDPVSPKGNTVATNFNPFNTDINTVRGQETGYATLNPFQLHNSADTLSDGNLKLTSSGSGSAHISRSNIPMSSGKYFCEVKWIDVGQNFCGIQGSTDINYNNSYIYLSNAKASNSNGSSEGNSYGATWTNGDIIGIAYDADKRTLEFFKNGVSQGVAFTGISQTYSEVIPTDYVLFFGNWSAQNATYELNCGQKPFKFSPPDGFKPLNNTSIIPETVIPRSNQFVGVTTYTGSVSPQTVGGINFTSDFIWIKSRTHTAWHILQDSVRGFGKTVFANDANAEVGNANDLISNVSSTGFSVNTTYAGGTDTATTTTSGTNNYVAWCWKAGGNKNTFNVDDVGYASASDVGMNVGGQNSNAYNTSQIWSSTYAGSAIDGSYPITQAFDGNRSTAARVSALETVMSVALTNITVTNKIEVFGELGFNTPNVSVTVGGVTHNIGGDPSTAVGGSAGTTTKTITGVSGALTNVTVGKMSSGRSYLSQIIVDGKILVNSNITPPNAPLKANTGASVGTRQGFSIIKFTNDSTNPITLSHGLTQAPTFVLLKALTGTVGWTVGHTSIGFRKRLKLNGTDAESASANFFNDTAPTSSLITLGANNVSNDFIMYSWHDVPGLQKFGSYMNLSSSNASFVELGFKPAVLIFKCVRNISSSSGLGDWIIKDTTRSPTNNPDDGNTLVANVANAEDSYYSAGQAAVDILSNGFKIRHGGSSPGGDTGRLYIYAAWAESPAVNLYGGSSNAR